VQRVKNEKEMLENYAASYMKLSYGVLQHGRITSARSNSSDSLSAKAGEQRGGIILCTELSSAGLLLLHHRPVRSAFGLRSDSLVLLSYQFFVLGSSSQV